VISSSDKGHTPLDGEKKTVFSPEKNLYCKGRRKKHTKNLGEKETLGGFFITGGVIGRKKKQKLTGGRGLGGDRFVHLTNGIVEPSCFNRFRSKFNRGEREGSLNLR